MLSQKSFPSIDQYSHRLNESVLRSQKMLERGESRLGSRYTSVRSHARKSCNGIVQVRFASQNDEAYVFTAHMGNISSNGLSFLSPGMIAEENILVGVPLSNQTTTWLKAVVVRSKKIPNEDFWEYGVKFDGRLQ